MIKPSSILKKKKTKIVGTYYNILSTNVKYLMILISNGIIYVIENKKILTQVFFTGNYKQNI